MIATGNCNLSFYEDEGFDLYPHLVGDQTYNSLNERPISYS